MPALLERPKLSNAMARALHRHIMMERERKRQEEEEVDKMMEQKMKEEQEPQNMDNSKAVQGVLMGLLSPHLIMGQHNQPIVLASSSEPHQHFLQCSTYLSHSHNPMQCMATFSPLRQGSSSPAVPSLCRNRWSMPTSRPASRTHLLCGPCTPKLCIQPLDSWLPPSFPYRYKQQGR
ncbi:mCG22494, isoform CRA_a [Mus musculus]|nr:mCG22494, isoform CRA_a [Mus musculus]